MDLQPQVTQYDLTQEELEGAAAFDRIYGNNAHDFIKATENQAYKLSAKTTDGLEIGRTLAAPNVDAAARQAWQSIQDEDRKGLEIASARLEWESEEDGPEVEYLYDAKQGIETYRPEGITLSNERALVAQTINESQENGALRVGTDQQTVVAVETNEVIKKPTEKEVQSALATRSALEAERQNILVEAQTPHEVGLDGALKSYVNGRADAYNNIRNALAESSAVELPKMIEPEEINVAPPTLAIDDRQQSLALSI
jgi:hypothetical protein